MLKITLLKIFIALAALCLPILGAAAPYDVIVNQRDSTDTIFLVRTFTAPAASASGLMYLDGPTTLPGYLALGTGLSISSGTLNAAAQLNADWNAVAGIAQIANKPSFAAIAFSGQYSDLVGAPTVQAIQRTRAQTNAAGALTWTFPQAYGSGVTPIVSVTVEDATTGVTWNQQITAVSNAGVTIQLAKTTVVAVLGISVLGVAATPQAFVHMVAVAP